MKHFSDRSRLIVSRGLLYGLIPAAIALCFILKVFTAAGCLAFDHHDDANHTFVNLFAARSILQYGELPMMNLYNNFGTPILGDALTYPFGIQSLTYYFLADPVAMTVNRFLVAFLTIAVLTYYFRRRLSAFSASVCAVSVFLLPGFLWHSAHHHYQMAELFFAMLLICQENWTARETPRNLLLFYAVFVLCVLSVSVNLVLIFFVFLLANQLLLSNGRTNLKFFILIGIGASAFLFYLPETLTFIHSIQISARVEQGYGLPYDWRRLALGIVGQVQPWRGGHLDAAIYVSIPVMALACLGGIELAREKETRSTLRQVCMLGLAPLLGVVLCLRYQSIWWAIPLVKSTDITRIWWASGIFLITGAGFAIDSIMKCRCRFQTIFLFLAASVVIIGIGEWWLHWQQVGMTYRLPIYGMPFAALVYLIGHYAWGRSGVRRDHRWAYFISAALFGLLVIGVYVPSAVQILGLNRPGVCRPEGTHHFSERDFAEFQPPELLNQMTPYSRMAAEQRSGQGQDLRALRHHILGSAGRSVFVKKAFADYLLDKGMIAVEQTPLAYHFVRPWDTEQLARLGIRYIVPIVGPSAQLAADGWRLTGNFANLLFVYENPGQATLAYGWDGDRRIPIADDRVHLRGNGLNIHLPGMGGARELVATFLALPGWQAKVDGRPRPIFHEADQLIRLHVKPGEQMVQLQYAPYGWVDVIAGAMLSLALVLGMAWRLVKRPSGSGLTGI